MLVQFMYDIRIGFVQKKTIFFIFFQFLLVFLDSIYKQKDVSALLGQKQAEMA